MRTPPPSLPQESTVSLPYSILTEEVGMDPTDIIFDINVLTIATGMDEHAEYGKNFIFACRMIKVRREKREGID